MKFDNPKAVTFKVSRETRTIKGLALPWGDVGDNGYGRFTFAPGSLTWGRVKLLNDHDWTQLLGTVDLDPTDEGLLMSAKVAATTLGDEVLALAEMGALDGLSVGLADDLVFQMVDGVHHVTSGTVLEVSTTPIPAFENAAIRSVAASAAGATKEGSHMADENTTEDAGADVGARVTDLENRVGSLEETVAGLQGDVAETEAEVAQLSKVKVPVQTFAKTQVREESIYRFAGTNRAPSGFDFAEDLLNAARFNDRAALERVQKFSAENFGQRFVSTANVDELSPTEHRPDMFLGQAPAPASPLFDFFRKGSIDSPRSFDYSKLDRAATTVSVANHAEGVEPTVTNLVTAVGATVTPSAVSGKVHINREVGDLGGNPNASALVWAEFERSYGIALETKTAALIAAAAGSITSLTSSIAAGADGAALGLALKKGLLKLQFLADGSRFVKGFGHEDLYTELATYENADGEPLYPIINPQNRDGISGEKYSFVDVAGYRFTPAASLGASSSNASLSYVADPMAVHAWNSGLTHLDKLGEDVKGWDLGVFGYFAGIVYDATGLRKISYDPAA